MFPLKNYKIADINSVGDFGHKRSFYYHPGIDIYTNNNEEIFAIESGKIVNIEIFTGPNANPTSPWWNETFSIMIEGNSGVIGYCELILENNLKINNYVKEGDLLGKITPVLKKDKGVGTSMLHLELYTKGTKEHCSWLHEDEKPENLLNPRELLEKCIIT
jgi:hypothetical protein